jgi:hypothetical protein
MASVVYNNFKSAINANDWTAGTFKVLLAASSYVPNIDTHVFVADVTGELSGGTYARQTIANRTRSVDNANDRCDYLADNNAFAGLNTTGATTLRWAVVFKQVTNDADSILVAAVQLTVDVNVPASPATIDFTCKWNNGATNGAVFRAT